MKTEDAPGVGEPAVAPAIPATLSLPLHRPIEWVDVTKTELDLREPRVTEWLGVAELEGIESDVRLIGMMTGIPESFLKTMGVKDFRAASAYLARFFATPDGPAGEIEGEIPEECTITLREPVAWPPSAPKEEATSYTLREPTVAEWQRIDKLKDVAADVEAVHILTGLSKNIIGQFYVRDLIAGAQYLSRFFLPAPALKVAS